MPEIKLARLPDRTPVRFTITASPKLARALRQYAGIYRATYGEAESVEDLIPFMLEAFLAGDHGFAKASKDLAGEEQPVMAPPPAAKRRGRPSRPVAETIPSENVSTQAREE